MWYIGVDTSYTLFRFAYPDPYLLCHPDPCRPLSVLCSVAHYSCLVLDISGSISFCPPGSLSTSVCTVAHYSCLVYIRINIFSLPDSYQPLLYFCALQLFSAVHILCSRCDKYIRGCTLYYATLAYLDPYLWLRVQIYIFQPSGFLWTLHAFCSQQLSALPMLQSDVFMDASYSFTRPV